MGVVYLAYDPELEVHRTVKLLVSPELTSKVERLRDEARVLARLKHNNIVRVTHFGVTTDERKLPYFVMEEAHGQSLQKLVFAAKKLSNHNEAEPVFSLTEALDIAVELFEGLDYAHEQGVIHRDIKPDNIIILREGIVTTIKLIDFGLSTHVNREGLVLGTPLYASPEQLQGKVISLQSDLYSAGQTLYEMLCGHAPFWNAESIGELSRAHLQKEPPDICEVVPIIPPALGRLVMQLIEKKPSKRPRNAREVIDRLRKIRQEFHARFSSPKLALATDPGRAQAALDGPEGIVIHDGHTRPIAASSPSVRRTEDLFGRNTLDLAAPTAVDAEFPWLEELRREERSKVDRRGITHTLEPQVVPDKIYVDFDEAVHLADEVIYAERDFKKSRLRARRRVMGLLGPLFTILVCLSFAFYFFLHLK